MKNGSLILMIQKFAVLPKFSPASFNKYMCADLILQAVVVLPMDNTLTLAMVSKTLMWVNATPLGLYNNVQPASWQPQVTFLFLVCWLACLVDLLLQGAKDFAVSQGCSFPAQKRSREHKHFFYIKGEVCGYTAENVMVRGFNSVSLRSAFRLRWHHSTLPMRHLPAFLMVNKWHKGGGSD